MPKKSYLAVVFLMVLAILLSACSTKTPVAKEAGMDKIKVAATIFPLFDLVGNVGGEHIDRVLILPPGASPHTFEVTPTQVKAVQGTKIMFTIGGEVDAWASEISNAIPGVKVKELNSYLEMKPFGSAGKNISNNHISLDALAGGEEEAGFDPHTWLDPDKAVKMAEKIAGILGQIDPENKDDYISNAQDFANSISSKDREWQAMLNKLNKKDLILFHDAWGYFADHFGLRIVGAFEPFPGKQPSPSYIVELQKKAREFGINTLFVEPQFSEEAVDALAGDMQVKTAVLDPLGGVAGRNSYLELIDYNVNTIYNALRQ